MQLSVPHRHGLHLALALAGTFGAAVLMFAETAAQTPASKPAAAKPAAKPAPAASAPGKGTSDRFTATAINLAGVAGETITVDLLRWSTDAEREKAVATLKDKGDKELLTLLQGSPNLGYIWRSGSGFGSFVRYAYKWKAADGEHVVLVTDSDLSTWQTTPGKPPSAAKYPYTVIELALGVAGAGKMSLAGKVLADSDAKTIRLEDFKTAPLSLKGVRHIKGSAG